MVQGGAFDKIRDETMITVLTGAQMTITGKKHQVAFDVLDPGESRGGLERCQILRNYALRLESEANAFAARVDEEDEKEADLDRVIQHKKEMAKEAADQVQLESALRGCASSGDKPLEPGIVARGEIRIIAHDLTRKIMKYDDEAKAPVSEQGSEEPVDNTCPK